MQILKEYFSQIFRGRNQDHSSKECFVNNNFLKTSCYKKETEHHSYVNTDADLQRFELNCMVLTKMSEKNITYVAQSTVACLLMHLICQHDSQNNDIKHDDIQHKNK